MKTTLTSIIRPIANWYRDVGKPLPWRQDPTPYHVWISEIMLQQTRIEAVIPYYRRFLAELPDAAALAACDDERLMKLWQGLGYYSRARNLKKAAQVVVSVYGGELPSDFAALRALPGIGDYTAGAIASIAFGLPEPAVDGNVLRVMARVLACGDDIAKASTKRRFTDVLREVYPSGDAARQLTEGIMELGETVCVPNGEPHCEACPIAAFCAAKREGLVDRYPVKSAKAARKIEQRTVLLIESGGKFAIGKRPERGLLAGLWEFPSLPGEADADAIAAFLAEQDLTHTGGVQKIGEAVHIFTHVEWHMLGLRIAVEGEPRTLTFASPEELRDVYAIPTAFRRFTQEIFKTLT